MLCDDQQRHKPRSIVRFGQRAGVWVSTQDDVREPGERSRGGVVPTARGYRLVCPLCGRDVRARMQTLTPVLDGLVGAQIDTVTLVALASHI